jgi:hypothetical protein
MVSAVPPSPLAIFQKAQTVWEARRLPPYIEFDVQIEHRDSAGTTTTGIEHVPLRSFDHWCKTSETDSDSAQIKTSVGPSCVGPGGSPLGFNIAAQYPDSKQIDPFAPGPHTIASLRAIHYFVQSAGEEAIDGHECYHLLLRAIHDPQYYPLREVWIDDASFDVRRLTYAMQQNGWNGSSIGAAWTPPPKDHGDLPFTSKLDVTNVRFPAP